MLTNYGLHSNWLTIYFQRNILAILLLGFSSGLPLALTASTLSVWLVERGLSLTSIGLFGFAATPYALKFLWSPLIDGTRFPLLCRWFGRRRGWLLATQALLMASIALLGLCDPAKGVLATALAALLVALCSASQDIVIDAYRVELLPAGQQGAGAAAIVLGYRLGMIASSAGALYLAGMLGWQMDYMVMALLVSVGMAAAFLAGEPARTQEKLPLARSPAQWIKETVIAPFADFMTREAWLLLLLFILLYKLPDAFMGMQTNPFLIKIGFHKDQIATIVKLYGIGATIFGSFIGGWLVFRLGLFRSLFLCGIAHALTNLMFVLQARAGADTQLLALSITLENITGGMGTSAFVAFISQLCNTRFTATQYALLSSFAAFGRTWLSTPAGWVAERLGWEGFFAFAAALALPGLLVLWQLRNKLKLE